MKKVMIMVALLVTCTFAAWIQLGPDGGYVRSLCVSHLDESSLYCVTYTYPAKCYKSINSGASWTKMGTLNAYPYCMVNDNNDNLYVGYYGVQKSTNGGVSWTNSTTSGYVYHMALHPTIATTIYATGYKYVSPDYQITFWKSTNSGTNWTPTTIATGRYCYGRSIAADPTNGNVIYVGGNTYDTLRARYEPKVYKSTDGGTSFNEIFSDTLGYYVYSLAVHPTNPNIVYVGSYTGGIWRSTDAGMSWTKVSTLYYHYVMKTTPANPNLVMSGGSSAIYRSTDAGLTWTSHTTGLKGSGFYGLDISHINASTAYVSDNAGFFKTSDMGTNWQMSNTGIMAGEILDCGIAPSQPATMYTEFENVGVYKTTDYGSSWTLLITPSTCGALCAFAVNAADPSEVYALEGSG